MNRLVSKQFRKLYKPTVLYSSLLGLHYPRKKFFSTIESVDISEKPTGLVAETISKKTEKDITSNFKNKKFEWGNISQIVSATAATFALIYIIRKYNENRSEKRLKYTDEIRKSIKDKHGKVIDYLIDYNDAKRKKIEFVNEDVPTKREISNLLDEFEILHLYLEHKILKVDHLRHLVGYIVFNLLVYPDAVNLLKEEPVGWSYFISIADKLVEVAKETPNSNPHSSMLIKDCEITVNKLKEKLK